MALIRSIALLAALLLPGFALGDDPSGAADSPTPTPATETQPGAPDESERPAATTPDEVPSDQDDAPPATTRAPADDVGSPVPAPADASPEPPEPDTDTQETDAEPSHDHSTPHDQSGAHPTAGEPAEPVAAPPAPPLQTPPAPRVAVAPDAENWAYPLVPRFRFRGLLPFIVLSMMTGLAFALSVILHPVRILFLSSGMIPRVLAGAQQAARVLAVILGLGAIAAVVPNGLEAILPIIVIAGSVAIGWSTRELAADIIAGIALATERSFSRGDFIKAEEIGEGRVVHLGYRGVVLRSPRGDEVTIPNRRMLRAAIRVDTSRWPSLELLLTAPADLGVAAVRQCIEEGCAASPWLAPDEGIQLIGPSEQPGCWLVRVRILEYRFADAFSAALREYVAEAALEKDKETP